MRSVADMRRSYELGGLSEADLAPTWLEQFGLWFEQAAPLPEPNAMVLATATPEGVPSARTVLLKGFDERGFVLYTNLESRKGREALANPHASLVFPWHDLQRQVVVRGTVDRVPGQEADAYFASRPRGSRLGAWASAQSRPVADRAALEAERDRRDAQHPDEVPRPPAWGGLRVVPHWVEFWQGRPDRLHDRLVYRLLPGGWVVERLAP